MLFLQALSLKKYEAEVLPTEGCDKIGSPMTLGCSRKKILDLLSCLEAHSIRPGWRQADLRPRGRASRCLGMPGAQKIGGKGESSCEHTLHGDPPGA